MCASDRLEEVGLMGRSLDPWGLLFSRFTGSRRARSPIGGGRERSGQRGVGHAQLAVRHTSAWRAALLAQIGPPAYTADSAIALPDALAHG